MWSSPVLLSEAEAMVQCRFASEQNVVTHNRNASRNVYKICCDSPLDLVLTVTCVVELRAKFCFLFFTSDLCWVNWLHVGGASYQNTFQCCAGRHKNTWWIATIKDRSTWFYQLPDPLRNWITRIIEAVTALLYRVIDLDKYPKSLLF